MLAQEFLRKVQDEKDRIVILDYAETTATFYVKRVGSFNSAIATDDVVMALRCNGVRIIGVPVMWSTRFPVYCVACDNIIGVQKKHTGYVFACDDCAASMLSMSVDEYRASNPEWLEV